MEAATLVAVFLLLIHQTRCGDASSLSAGDRLSAPRRQAIRSSSAVRDAASCGRANFFRAGRTRRRTKSILNRKTGFWSDVAVGEGLGFALDLKQAHQKLLTCPATPTRSAETSTGVFGRAGFSGSCSTKRTVLGSPRPARHRRSDEVPLVGRGRRGQNRKSPGFPSAV